MQTFNLKEFLNRYQDDVENNVLFKILEKLPNTSEQGPWIAGGAIRRTIINKPLESDFDFFFKDEEQMRQFCIEMGNIGFIETASNEHNKTFAGTVDKKNILVQAIIIRYYNTIEDVLDSFDFTITQFGYDGINLYCGDYSLFDLKRNKLSLHKLTYGVSTVRRMIKYTKQGFTACQGTFVDILTNIVNNPSLIEADIKYID